MTAVFAFGIGVAFKLDAAFGADYLMDSFSVYLVAVIAPPCHTAFVRAEPFRFPFGLFQTNSALPAACSIFYNRHGLLYVVAAAIGFYGVYIDARIL
jgi:ethanolamine utilization microcompartment shell protein EutL